MLRMLPVILVLGVSVLLHTKAEQPRLDCHPEPGTNQDECKKRKCIWNETVVHYGQLKILHYNSPCIMLILLQIIYEYVTFQEETTPKCYYPPQTGYFKYGQEKNFWILNEDQDKSVPCPYQKNFPFLRISQKNLGSILNIRIEPNDTQRYMNY